MLLFKKEDILMIVIDWIYVVGFIPIIFEDHRSSSFPKIAIFPCNLRI